MRALSTATDLEARREAAETPGGNARAIGMTTRVLLVMGTTKHDDDPATAAPRGLLRASPRASRASPRPRAGTGARARAADGVRRSVQAQSLCDMGGDASDRGGSVRPGALLPALPPPRGVRRALAGVARGGGREGRAERARTGVGSRSPPRWAGARRTTGERRRNAETPEHSADGFRMLRRLRRQRRRGRRRERARASNATDPASKQQRLGTSLPSKEKAPFTPTSRRCRGRTPGSRASPRPASSRGRCRSSEPRGDCARARPARGGGGEVESLDDASRARSKAREQTARQCCAAAQWSTMSRGPSNVAVSAGRRRRGDGGGEGEDERRGGTGARRRGRAAFPTKNAHRASRTSRPRSVGTPPPSPRRRGTSRLAWLRV